MARRKATKVKAKLRRIKGRGDYDIFDDPGGPVPVKQNPIKNLESRVSKLESRVPKPKSTVGKAAGMGGRLLGSLIGQGDLGETAATEIAKWFGHGDYNLKGNSLVTSIASGGSVTGAKFDNDGRRGTRITEREYIGDVFSGELVNGSTVFTNGVYVINPGDPKTFPWLSVIATQFEEYIPHGIIFEFVSTSSTFNGASQALGTVIMATDYDPDDPAYVSKIEMENADYSNSTKSSSNCVHGIECDPSERAVKTLYVRTGELGSQPRKFYDLGNFQLATFGMSTENVNLGELWVSYDITFYKKQVNASLYGNYIFYSAMSASDGIVTTPLGQNNRQTAGNLELKYTTNSITFPSYIVTGKYVLNVMWRLSDPTGTAPSVPTTLLTYTNCAPVNIGTYSGDINMGEFAGNNALAIPQPSDDELSIITYTIQINGPNAKVEFPDLDFGNKFRTQVRVFQIPFASQPLYVN